MLHQIRDGSGIHITDTSTHHQTLGRGQAHGSVHTLDKELNARIRGTETVISSADSKIKVVVVPTDEEMIVPPPDG